MEVQGSVPGWRPLSSLITLLFSGLLIKAARFMDTSQRAPVFGPGRCVIGCDREQLCGRQLDPSLERLIDFASFSFPVTMMQTGFLRFSCVLCMWGGGEGGRGAAVYSRAHVSYITQHATGSLPAATLPPLLSAELL